LPFSSSPPTSSRNWNLLRRWLCLWCRGLRGRCLRWTSRHFGVGKPRQQRISRRKLVGRPRYHHRIFLYIVLEYPLIGIKICVPGVAVVLNRILTHSDSG